MTFPYYKQLDSMDCGATCLRMIAKFYGKAFSAAFFRERCHTTRKGVSMLSISDAAESVGFRTMGVKISFEQICKDVNLPCIIHWNQKHFAIIYKIKRNKNGEYEIWVADPASGLLKYKKDIFLKCWLSSANNLPDFVADASNTVDEEKNGINLANGFKIDKTNISRTSSNSTVLCQGVDFLTLPAERVKQ